MRAVGFIVALVLAIGVMFVVLKMMGGDKAPGQQIVQQSYKTVNILVAADDIPIGRVIKQEMIETQPWPEHLVLDGFIVSNDNKNILEMIARANFKAGEPIILNKLANPKSPSFLAANIGSGKKVVTISVDNVSSVGGFVEPGDMVDVMVVHKISKEGDGVKQEDIAETILSNIRVLAVDQRVEGGQLAEGESPIPSVISLEVTMEDAQKIRLAQSVGYITLTLRSLEDRNLHDSASATKVSDFSGQDFSNVKEEKIDDKDISVKIVRGSTVESTATSSK